MSSTTKKFTLDDEGENNEGYTIGIITSLPVYTLCWHINKLLTINLVKIKDFEIPLKKQKPKTAPGLFDEVEEEEKDKTNVSQHSIYKYNDESLYVNYYLVENKGSAGILWPEMKKVTCFLSLDAVPGELNTQELLFSLNNIESVEMAYETGDYCLTDKLQLTI